MTRPELASAAERLWLQSGMTPTGTRSVREVVSWVHSVTIETHHALSIATIQGWMAGQGFTAPIDDPNRRLRGCAVASAGTGLIFVDASDPIEEREFTIAHEVAHLLLDYYGPREHSVRLIGAGARGVFDGSRAASFPEHLTAALHGESLRPFVHLLARDANFVASAAVLAREALADELACELLVPTDEVLEAMPGRWSQKDATSVLVERFQLPPAPAADYARRLVRRFQPAPTFVDWLAP